MKNRRHVRGKYEVIVERSSAIIIVITIVIAVVLCCVYFVFNSLCHFATEYKKRNMPPPLDSVRLVWLVIMIKWTEQKQSKANQFEFEAKETLTGRIPYSHTIHSSGWKSHRQCLEIRMFMLWHWSRTSQSQSWFDFSCWCFFVFVCSACAWTWDGSAFIIARKCFDQFRFFVFWMKKKDDE